MASTGGAIQQLTLVDLKYQDSFLTGKPQFNFIKQVYKQYENFAIERIAVPSDNVLDFGKHITFKIKKSGDFLKKIYFSFDLPALVRTSGTYAGWTNSIGYAIIDYFYIKINSIEIDRQYGLYLAIWNELTKKEDDDILIGKYRNISSLRFNALTTSNYSVELPFWFSQNIASALPLISLSQSNPIEIVMYLNDFDKCVVYDGNTGPIQASVTNGILLTDQIFMGDASKKKFKAEPHVYIIKQLQYNSDDVAGNSKKMELTFSHPLNQLLFVIREKASELNNDWFNFSLRNSLVHTKVLPLLERARLLVDAKPRHEYQSSHELSIINSKLYYTNTIDTFIYTIPFCNDPVVWLPNGTLNFSVPQLKELQLELIQDTPACSLHVFGVNFNFLTINNELVTLQYST